MIRCCRAFDVALPRFTRLRCLRRRHAGCMKGINAAQAQQLTRRDCFITMVFRFLLSPDAMSRIYARGVLMAAMRHVSACFDG